MKRTRILVFLLLCIFATVMISACSKSPTEEEKAEAPALPPAASMSMNISAFGSSSSSLAKPAIPASQQNFNNALIRVAILNTAVVIHMSLPTAIFVAAISQKPTLEQDGKFHWVYEIKIGLNTYKADLAGWVDRKDMQIKWEMYVTNPTFVPALEDFLWYDGWTNLENNQGQWTFYDPKNPNAGDEVIKIDWNYKSEQDAVLTFTNVWQGHDETGDELEYKVNNNDRSITFYDKSEDMTWTIFWDAETSAGYLQVPGYNNGLPAYWDENHNDIEGP